MMRAVMAVAEGLRRELRVRDLVALGITGIIGPGIFFLPGKVAALLGPASLLSFLLASLLCTLLVLCFAEMGSRFSGTGGPMLYCKAAFNDTTAFLVGWVTWLNRVIAWAALACAFVIGADTLLPGVRVWQTPILITLFSVLAALNIRGVAHGAQVTNVLTALKMLPIVVFVGLGLLHLNENLFTPFAPHGVTAGNLGQGTLLIFYAFAGFEGLAIPAGEVRAPKMSLPRALVLTMVMVTVAYLAIWAVSTGTHAGLAGSENPLAEAAQTFLGPLGGTMVATGIFLSVIAINAAAALVAPRSLYALAHEGYLPSFFGKVNANNQTPAVAIVVTAALSMLLAVSGSFVTLASMSVVARFAQYIPTCVAMPVLRMYDRHEQQSNAAPKLGLGCSSPAFRLPFGATIPTLAIAICIWLLTQTRVDQLLWGLVGLFSGLIFYLPMRYSAFTARYRVRTS